MNSFNLPIEPVCAHWGCEELAAEVFDTLLEEFGSELGPFDMEVLEIIEQESGAILACWRVPKAFHYK